MATSRAGSWLLARSLRHLDRVAEVGFPGDRTATELLAGLPVVILTTTGARTGRPRSVRLVPVVTADVFAVLGTNFGQRGSPSWALNLLHDPAAVLEYRGRRLEVRACELDGRSRDDVVAAAARLYPGFAGYVRRASGRRVHVFALVG
jgi:deazaflavin-dependent oxidoreductase (nitroreductase family)